MKVARPCVLRRDEIVRRGGERYDQIAIAVPGSVDAAAMK
jgi:hypothetical protein